MPRPLPSSTFEKNQHNFVDTAEFFCVNSMVFESTMVRKAHDTILFNLELVSSGHIIGSKTWNNIFHIYDGGSWNRHKRDIFTSFLQLSFAVVAPVVAPLPSLVMSIPQHLPYVIPVLDIPKAAVLLTDQIIADTTLHIEDVNEPTFANSLTIWGGNKRTNHFVFHEIPFRGIVRGGERSTNVLDFSSKCKQRNDGARAHTSVAMFRFFSEIKFIMFFFIYFF